MIKYLIFLLSVTAYASSQKHMKGQCQASLTLKGPLSVPQAIGKWITYIDLGNEGLKCTETTFSVNEKAQNWRLNSVTKAVKVSTGEPVVVNGYIYNITNLEDASIWRTGRDGQDESEEGYIVTIAWDYDTFLVSYWCHPDGEEFKDVTLRVHLREKNPSNETLKSINEALRTVGMDGETYDKIDQNNCN